MCNESLFYVVFYDDKTSVYTTFKFLKNEIIKYPVSCILYLSDYCPIWGFNFLISSSVWLDHKVTYHPLTV